MADDASPPGWVGALAAFTADEHARVRCPDCDRGPLRAWWVASGHANRGEVILSCELCGAWHAALCTDGRPSSWQPPAPAPSTRRELDTDV